MNIFEIKRTLKPLKPIEKKHKNIERILEERKLKKEAERLSREEKKIYSKIEKLSKNCNHEILISMGCGKENLGFTRLSICKCLFCNGTFGSRKYVPEDILKKMEKAAYIKITQRDLDPDIVLNEIQDMYIRIRANYPDASEMQIANKMDEEINEKKLFII